MSTGAHGCGGNVLTAAFPPAGGQPCRRKGAAKATQPKTLCVPEEEKPVASPQGPTNRSCV